MRCRSQNLSNLNRCTLVKHWPEMSYLIALKNLLIYYLLQIEIHPLQTIAHWGQRARPKQQYWNVRWVWLHGCAGDYCSLQRELESPLRTWACSVVLPAHFCRSIIRSDRGLAWGLNYVLHVKQCPGMACPIRAGDGHSFTRCSVPL